MIEIPGVEAFEVVCIDPPVVVGYIYEIEGGTTTFAAIEALAVGRLVVLRRSRTAAGP